MSKENNTNVFGGDVNKPLGIFGKNALQKERDNEWGGSCFGIAASSALNYTDYIDINNITGESGSYYEVTSKINPSNNQQLNNVINYYQLAQYTNLFMDIDDFNENMTQSSMNESLRRIISKANKAELSGVPFILVMRYTYDSLSKNSTVEKKSGGHAVVCVGCEGYDQDGVFQLRIIDPNEQKHYIYMRIYIDDSGNYSFDFNEEYNAENNNHQFQYIDSIDLNSLYPLQHFRDDQPEQPISFIPNTTHLSFDNKDCFRLTDEDTGRYLDYDGNNLSGNLEIEKSSAAIKTSGEYTMMLDIEYGTKYTVSVISDTIDITIASDTDFYSVDSYGVDSIEFDLNGDILIDGNDMYFNAYVSAGDDSDLVRITGDADSTVNIKRDNDNLIIVEYKGEGTIEDICLFDDEHTYEYEFNRDISGFQISIEGGKLITNITGSLGDINLDGKVNTADAVALLKKSAGMLELSAEQESVADVNHDGNINTADAVYILKFAAGLIPEL